jgi:hypothetical protein
MTAGSRLSVHFFEIPKDLDFDDGDYKTNKMSEIIPQNPSGPLASAASSFFEAIRM